MNGIAHTNSLESFWALFKRGLTGIYHWVSDKHVDRYLIEFSTRYNTRKYSESERFNKVLSQCNGRLKYKTLIAKPKNIHKIFKKNVEISKKDVNLPF